MAAIYAKPDEMIREWARPFRTGDPDLWVELEHLADSVEALRELAEQVPEDFDPTTYDPDRHESDAEYRTAVAEALSCDFADRPDDATTVIRVLRRKAAVLDALVDALDGEAQYDAEAAATPVQAATIICTTIRNDARRDLAAQIREVLP